MKRTVLIITLPFLILTNSCGVKDGEHVIETWEDGKPKIINIWKDGEYKKVKYYPNGEKEESGKYVKREGVYVPDGVFPIFAFLGALIGKPNTLFSFLSIL